MVGECRVWRNDDGIEYVVTTVRGVISEGFFARAEPQDIIVFEGPSGEAWRTVYSGRISLHREPDFGLRHYLGTAKHDPPRTLR